MLQGLTNTVPVQKHSKAAKLGSPYQHHADVFVYRHVTNYNFISLVYSAYSVKSKHDLDLQLWLISRPSCCNTFKISIF